MERKRDQLTNRIKKAKRAESEKIRKQRTRQLIVLGGDLKAISERALAITINSEKVSLIASFWDDVFYSKLTDEQKLSLIKLWNEYVEKKNRERTE